MAIAETWLHTHKDGELANDGYKLFRGDRKRTRKSTRGRLSGGVGCYVRLDIAPTMEIMVNYSNGVVELLGLYSKVKNLYIAIIYRQPDDWTGGHRSTDKEFKQALDKLRNSFAKLPEPAPNIILCGDFNIRKAVWPEGNPSPVSTNQEKLLLQSLAELTNDYFLSQYITTPTHVDGGVLDLVFTNNPCMVHSYGSLKPLRTTSDHFVVEIMTPLLCDHSEKEEEKPGFASALDNLNFFSDDIDWEKMSAEIKTLTHLDEFSSLPPSERLNRFLAIFSLKWLISMCQ